MAISNTDVETLIDLASHYLSRMSASEQQWLSGFMQKYQTNKQEQIAAQQAAQRSQQKAQEQNNGENSTPPANPDTPDPEVSSPPKSVLPIETTGPKVPEMNKQLNGAK